LRNEDLERDSEKKAEFEKKLNYLKNCDILVIEDITKLKSNTAYITGSLWEIITYRCDRNKTIIMTDKQELIDALKFLDEAIYQHIKDFTKEIFLLDHPEDVNRDPDAYWKDIRG
jgi:DNA replication protein DnaC